MIYLHITMNHVRRVHELKSTEQLVHDVLFVYILKDICANDSVEVGFCEKQCDSAKPHTRSAIDSPMYSNTR